MNTPVISYPFGAADVQSKAYAATIAATIANQKTIVVIAELTGAVTLNATLSAELKAGAELVVVVDTDATPRTLTLGTGFEAQAIAIELEKMTPTRPLTHDLFKQLASNFEIEVKEVVIYNLQEGIFYSKLVCERDGQIQDIDARTSDAIAIGVRFNCPIYTFEHILASAGIAQDETDSDDHDLDFSEDESEAVAEEGYKQLSLQELENQLNQAIENEDYELASKIRDEITKRTS
jgi:bifunctional DNase/RNase